MCAPQIRGILHIESMEDRRLMSVSPALKIRSPEPRSAGALELLKRDSGQWGEARRCS